MRSKYYQIIALISLIALLVLIAVACDLTRAETYTVDDDGDGDYYKIHYAVENATDGDTIFVKPGLYEENIVVDTQLTIAAETGREGDVIVESRNVMDHVFYLTSDNVTINGLHVRNAANGRSGIYLDRVQDCVISGNTMYNNTDGLALWQSSHNTVSNNNVYQSTGWTGINVQMDCSFNVFSNNTVFSNIGNGIYIGGDCNHNIIQWNTIHDNQDVFEAVGIFLDHYDMYNIVQYNTIHSNNVGIELNDASDFNMISYNSVHDNLEYGIILLNLYPDFELGNSNNTIYRNQIYCNDVGINISGGSKDNQVHENSIIDNTLFGLEAFANMGYSVDATNNWWGDPSGPYHAVNNTEGKGDEVTDYVIFDPWTTEGNSKPIVTVTSPADEAKAIGTVTIYGTASDEDGDETLVSVEISIDNGAWETVNGIVTWTFDWNTTGLTEDRYTLTFRAYDGTDYSDIIEIELNVVKITENAKPVVTITTPTIGAELTGKVSAKGTASDNNSDVNVVQISIDNENWINVNGTHNWTYLIDTAKWENGEMTIRVRAFDGTDYSDIVAITVTINNDEDDDDSPGFELILLVTAIVIAALWRKRR